MILTTFGNAVTIQLVQLQKAQTTNQIKDKDRVNIVIKFFFKISFENMEKSEVEKPIFFLNYGKNLLIWQRVAPCNSLTCP